MSELPEGWSSAPLGDVCRVTSGATPQTGVAANWGGTIPWITPNDLSKDRSQTVLVGARSLTHSGYESCSARMFPRGSVIVSSRAPIGYVAIAGAEMCTNQGCKTATPPEIIEPKYLYWYLLSAKGDMESRGSGTTFKEISSRRFAETMLRWPSLAEQRRIVDVLEDHLSRLDAATRDLTSATKRNGSWTGGVTDSLLWEPGWPTREVGALLREPMRNGRSDRAVTGSGSGTRTLTLTAVTRNEFTDANTKITTTTPEVARGLWLEAGDIFVQRANTPELVGTAARFDGNKGWAIFPDLLIRLRADESMIDSRFMVAALRSQRTHRSLRMRAKGLAGSMPKIDQAAVAGTVLPLPPLSEQRTAVERLAEVDSATSALTGSISVQNRRAASLRRALLAAAFSGRLTGSASDMGRVEELAQ